MTKVGIGEGRRKQRAEKKRLDDMISTKGKIERVIEKEKKEM